MEQAKENEDRKVRNDLLPYVEAILNREKKEFFIKETTDTFTRMKVFGVSGKAFHRIIVRAICEKRNAEEKIPKDSTYWKPGVENMLDIKISNPNFQFFYDYKNEEAR